MVAKSCLFLALILTANLAAGFSHSRVRTRKSSSSSNNNNTNRQRQQHYRPRREVEEDKSDSDHNYNDWVGADTDVREILTEYDNRRKPWWEKGGRQKKNMLAHIFPRALENNFRKSLTAYVHSVGPSMRQF